MANKTVNNISQIGEIIVSSTGLRAVIAWLLYGNPDKYEFVITLTIDKQLIDVLEKYNSKAFMEWLENISAVIEENYAGDSEMRLVSDLARIRELLYPETLPESLRR